VKISQATKMLVDTLGSLKGDLNSEEGKAILGALKVLAPIVPDVSEGMGRTELMSMLSQAQGVKPGPGVAPQQGMLGIQAPRPTPMGG
jgi:hypothetical protein